MKKDDVLRFKVSVPPVYSDLYEAMNKAGPYYRSRRLLQLALLGLSAEKGHLTNTAALTAPASSATPASSTSSASTSSAAKEQTTPENKIAKDPKQSYDIPENAAELIGDLLDSL